jgi:hypothetical protein
LEQVVLLSPDGTLADSRTQLAIELGQLLAQPADMQLDTRPHRFIGTRQAVLLGRQHLDELAPSGTERAQSLRGLVGKLTRFRPHGLRKAGEHLRIEPLGLRQSPERLGKRADLARIDDLHRQRRSGQLRGQRRFKAPGGLEDDQRRPPRRQLCDQLANPLRGIRRPPCLTGRLHRDVQHPLRNVHSDVHRPALLPTHAPCSARPCTFELCARPTVRARMGKPRRPELLDDLAIEDATVCRGSAHRGL